MNAKSLSPRSKPLRKSQLVLQQLAFLKKSRKMNDSMISVKASDSQISIASSRLQNTLSSSKVSLKLSSPYSQPSLNYSSSSKLRKISQKFAKLKSSSSPLGEHLLPMSSEQVISKFGSLLSKHELCELLDYRDVHYLGLKAKKVKPNIKLKNSGYDDSETDYIIVISDHIAYQFEILELLGSGSFAQVCKCWDHKHHKEVAIKIIKSHRRFQDQGQVELKVLAYLKRHDKSQPSLFVHMLEYFMFRGHLCIVFELLSFTLYDLLRANAFKGFSNTLVKRFTQQVLSGLFFLRQNHIIHCDLKPENIILTNPVESSIKIIDFGSSCFDDERIYFYIQSRIYRAPEVILGVPYTCAIDMWSLGCILAELATGSPLFIGENEVDQLWAIMEVLGMPPEAMIRTAQKRSKFFNNDGSPRAYANAKGKLRTLASVRLEDRIMCDEPLCVDFIKKWNPEKRITPLEALAHPWMQDTKRMKRVKSTRSVKSSRIKVT